MKKIISVILLSIFFFNSSYAEKYWSNKKDGPTNIKEARGYIFSILEKDYPKDASFDWPKLYGIWYSHQLGFVAIHPTYYKSKIYKMRLIKAPKGYGLNHLATKEQLSEYYKSSKDHEGTIEGTIIQNGKNFTGYNKRWWIQNDGSYKYTTSKPARIIFNSNYQFVYQRQAYTGIDGKSYPKNTEIFNKISPRSYDIFKVIKKIDSSKKISDFQIESRKGGLFIYFDSKYDNSTKIIKDKFIDIGANNDHSAGKIFRNTTDDKINGIDYIYCSNSTGLIYSKVVNDVVKVEKKYKASCDPLKINYSSFLYYKYRNFIYVLGALLFGLIIFFIIKFKNKNELANYNKKNKKKFETYLEYKEHLQILSDIEWKKDQKQQEKEKKAQEIIRKAQEAKRLKEEQKLEAEEKRREKLEREPVPVSIEESNDDNLMGKIKRLKVLYKNGTLTKTEFEKAKNKLLK